MKYLIFLLLFTYSLSFSQKELSKINDKNILIYLSNNPNELNYYPIGFPISSKIDISSYFGMRKNPFSLGNHFHSGIDLRCKKNTPVYSTANGKVEKLIFNDKVSGNAIVISHKDGFKTIYCHLNKILVKTGEIIRKDSKIALSGNTGKSTAPHLHYSIKINKRFVNPIGYCVMDVLF